MRNSLMPLEPWTEPKDIQEIVKLWSCPKIFKNMLKNGLIYGENKLCN